MVWKPHTTVAAVIERDEKFLMVEEIADGEHVINQPAGHLDPNESLVDAVKRETLEETAWSFQPDALVGIYLWKKEPSDEDTFLRFAFSGTCSDFDDSMTLDEGIIRAAWYSRQDLLDRSNQLRSPMVMRCIDDYLKGNLHSLDLLDRLS